MQAAMFIILCFLWGSTWMFIKIGLNDFPPLLFAGVRFLAATLVMWLILLWKKERLVWDWRALSPNVVFGVLNAVGFGLVFWGEQYLSSSLTAVINSMSPFFSVILARFLVGEMLSWPKAAGLAIGFSGIILIFGADLQPLVSRRMWGELAVLVAAVSYALAGVHLKKHHEAMKPIPAVTVQMGATAAVLLLVGIPLEAGSPITVSLAGTVSFLYLVLFGSVAAFLIYYYLVQNLRISQVAYVSMITPVIASLNGVFWLHEPLRWQLVVGFGLVITGMFFLNSSDRLYRYQPGKLAQIRELRGGFR